MKSALYVPMAFRADESVTEGRERALKYLVGRHIPAEAREHSEQMVHQLIDRYGPVVDSYPSWHPMVNSGGDKDAFRGSPRTRADDDTGFEGLDHTIYLRNGLITCPYGGVESIIESVEKLDHPLASFSVREIDAVLYMPGARPVLVECKWVPEWSKSSLGFISKRAAVGLLLEQELPHWQTAEVGETWDTMKSYILGSPHGSRSSLFVNEETGQALKTLWNALINTGLFGPIMV
jgi:hypothetical protein